MTGRSGYGARSVSSGPGMIPDTPVPEGSAGLGVCDPAAAAEGGFVNGSEGSGSGATRGCRWERYEIVLKNWVRSWS